MSSSASSASKSIGAVVGGKLKMKGIDFGGGKKKSKKSKKSKEKKEKRDKDDNDKEGEEEASMPTSVVYDEVDDDDYLTVRDKRGLIVYDDI